MTTVRDARDWLLGRNWLWVFAGALVVWLVIVFSTSGRGAGGVLSVSLEFATFYVVIGLGQMMVIATGPGNVDLSIPSVMTLAAYISMGVMNDSNADLVLGLISGVGVGLGCGLVHVVLIQALRIPPMIATLASGFIWSSVAMAYSTGSTASPAPMLSAFCTGRILGMPIIAGLFIVIAVVVAVVVHRTPFGRRVLAIGQNDRAAYLAGIKVRRTRSAVFVISALAASIGGILLAGASGGASLDMASGYLLMSIAVVVLGGTSILGGQVAVPGVWGAALLLYLIVSLLNVLPVSSGVRYLVIGLVIISVLAISQSGKSR